VVEYFISMLQKEKFIVKMRERERDKYKFFEKKIQVENIIIGWHPKKKKNNLQWLWMIEYFF